MSYWHDYLGDHSHDLLLDKVYPQYYRAENYTESARELCKFHLRTLASRNKVIQANTFQTTHLVYGEEIPLPNGPQLRKQRIFDSWEACQEYAQAGDLILIHGSTCLCNSHFNCKFFLARTPCVVTKPVIIINTQGTAAGYFICDLEGGSEQWKSSISLYFFSTC